MRARLAGGGWQPPALDIRQMYQRLGRLTLAQMCGVKPNTVSDWRCMAPGIHSARRLIPIAKQYGTPELVAALEAHVEERSRVHERRAYVSRCLLFSMSGQWPRGKSPQAPPPDLSAVELERAKRLLAKQGWTIIAGADGSLRLSRTL